jgi:hypothetical protein
MAAGEKTDERRREEAARAVDVFLDSPFGVEARPPAVEEEVHGFARKMAAFDETGDSGSVKEEPGRFFHLLC